MIYSNDMIHRLWQEYRDQGPVAKYQFNGENHVFVNHPDFVQHVMVKNYKTYNKSDFYKELNHVVGNGLFTVSGGDDWLWQRRMTQPSFTRDKISSYCKDVERVSADTIKRWHILLEDNDVILMQDEFVRTTLSIICATLLGINTKEEAEVVIRNFPHILKFINVRVFHPSPMPLETDTVSNVKFRKRLAEMETIVTGYIDRMIADKENGLPPSDSFISEMVHSVDEETGRPLSYEEIRDQVMTQFLAGHEGNVNSMVYICYHLALVASYQEDLYLSVLDDKHWTEYNDLLNFIYESIRLYPSVSVLSRVAMDDDTMAGVSIKKGDIVNLSPLILHRTPEFWDEPDNFNPKRFENFDLRKNRYLYIPFGAGPRLCIGMQLALMELVILTRDLIRNFRFEMTAETSPEYWILLTLRAKNGMPVEVTRR